ncbi:MAG: type II secretion system minor pseudopilin GspI [Thioalkalispiraceae bacterium]|jgi:general secretion pathway protein I
MKIRKGFTLLEVLVALAVLAIGMAALIKVTASNTSNTAYLKEKTFAHWVAVNKANELRVAKSWPDVGVSNGTVFMGKHEWRWKLKVSNTPDKNVRRLEIEVGREGADESVAYISAFTGRPL